MMMSPLRILILYRQVGFVQTHALYSIEAPWLPKSESGTRSPSLHLRHRGNAFSTKSPPSFSREDSIRLPDHGNQARFGDKDSRGGASATASASPQQYYIGLRLRYHTTKSFLCQHTYEDIFIIYFSKENLTPDFRMLWSYAPPAFICRYAFIKGSTSPFK
jgi:hypothetical protein